MTLDFRYLFIPLGTWIAVLIWKERRVGWLELRPRTCFAVFALAYFGIALVGKYLQLIGNELHGQDFWLFVDALNSAAGGGAWLTRFAPQGIGWVQHGAVHAFLPLFFFVPLVWVLGAKWTALLINPFALSLAGYFLALLARPRSGVMGALAWMLGFYALSANGKTLMYEAHPESLYPLLFFAVLLSLQSPQGRSRFLLPALACLFSLKLDALGLMLPVAMLCRAAGESWCRIALGMLLGLSSQWLALKGFAQGWLGPHQWAGDSPVIPSAGGLGISLAGGISMLATLTEWAGRVWDQLLITLRFLISRPLLSLVVPFFWVSREPQWWIGALGLGFLYSWVPGSMPLWNYYSAIWVALIFGVAVNLYARKEWLVAMVLLSCILGGGSPRWRFERADTFQVRSETESEAKLAVACLRSLQGLSPVKGVVGPGLLGAFWDQGRELILTERWRGLDSRRGAAPRFIILERGVDRYLMAAREVETIEAELRKSPGWVEMGASCSPGAMKRVTLWILRKIFPDAA